MSEVGNIDTNLPEHIGRYRTGKVLGIGGFGLVVRAEDDALGSPVAIKILGTDHSANEDFRKRFVDEARLLRSVRSDHLITIHDIGELEDGRPFFVMDLADRGTFADRLGAGKSASGIDDVSLQSVVNALADSLSALHTAGYVHRDVSPGNLLIQSRAPTSQTESVGEVTVIRSGLVGNEERLLLGDLGLAKDVVGRASVTIVGGTPRYCSPEQLDPDGSVGPATDVYGATALIWRVVTGQTPPESHKLEDRLQDVAAPWHEFMRRGMAENPEERFPNMQAWRAAAMAAAGSGSAHLASSTTDRYSADECPYQGLAAFQTQDADRFYGRDEMVFDLVDRLRHHRVLVVGGASGSGKSSLVRAGLIPAVRSGALPESARWPVLLFTPGADPLNELQYQLRKTLDSIHVLTTGMESSGADAQHWRRMAEKITDVTGGLLICIDQFEELFTFDHEAETLNRIIDAFSSISDPSTSLVKLVFVIRADFYASASRFQWLAQAASQCQLLVGPMSRGELQKAITEPARLIGLRVDDDLVETILQEVGNTSGTLPLVSHALAEAWKLRNGNRLTLENYRAAGGMFGAIGQSAETLYTERFDPAEQGIARRLLLRLVNPGEGVPDTRRPYAVAELQVADGSVLQTVMNALVDARLLTIDNDIIQLAHEAIILTWHRLRDWIDESRDDLRVLQRIERVASEWNEAGRDPDLLYHGTPLLTALEWYENHSDAVNELEAEFLTSAREAEESARLREEYAARRVKRFRQVAFVALTLLLVASTLSSIMAFKAYQEARSNEIAANFRLGQSLASQASDLADRDPRLALALAAEVIERQEVAPVEARAALVHAAAALNTAPYTPLSSVLVGDAISVAVHPQWDMVVTGDRNGSVGFWNTAGVSLGEPILAHGGAIEEFSFSADGKRLLSVGVDGTVMLWALEGTVDLPSPKLVVDLQSLLWSVSFSPDGKYFATAAVDGRTRLFSAVDFKQVFLLADTDRDFITAKFTPDSRELYAGNADGEVWGWHVDDGTPTFSPYVAHDSGIWEIEFYADGSRFTTTSSDGRVRVWDTQTRQRLHEPFDGAAEDVRGVQIDSKGLMMAGDENGRLLFWDTLTEQYSGASVARHDAQVIDASVQQPASLIVTLSMDQIMRSWLGYEEKSWVSLARHEEGAYGLAINHDSTMLATGDGGGQVRLFDMPDGKSAGIPLTLSEHRVWAVAFNTTGEVVAAADKQGSIAMWDVNTGRRIARINAAHNGSISTLAFHPDQDTLLSAGADGVIRQWDAATLEKRDNEMAGHTGGVSRFALSPDGQALVSADRTGALRIWKVAAATISQQWQADDNTIWSVAWSPDSQVLATAHADEFVRLWDAATGAALRELTPHPGGATDVAFLSDGVTIVSSSRDGALRLWDRELGLRLGEAFDRSKSPTWRVVGSRTGNWFATTNATGNVKVWNTLNEKQICQHAVWDSEAQRRYLGAGERPLACQQ